MGVSFRSKSFDKHDLLVDECMEIKIHQKKMRTRTINATPKSDWGSTKLKLKNSKPTPNSDAEL